MYVVARSANTNRPVCQHIIKAAGPGLTVAACGYDLSGASVTFLEQALDAILCMRCRFIRDNA